MRYPLLLFISFITCLTNCDSDPVEESPKDGVPVRSIEAAATFDLSAREDWLVYVEGHKYTLNVEGHKLTITSPEKAPYRFPYGAATGNVIIQMAPEDYGRQRDEALVPFNIEDQSTLRKFRDCDMLRFVYSGEVKENITGLKVYHFNTLLTFHIHNLPAGAKVYIKQIYNQKITPYKADSDIDYYKAIVFPNNQRVTLVVETPEKTHECVITPETYARFPGLATGTGNSAILSFTAEINEEDKLMIPEMEWIPYSDEWPIDQ